MIKKHTNTSHKFSGVWNALAVEIFRVTLIELKQMNCSVKNLKQLNRKTCEHIGHISQSNSNKILEMNGYSSPLESSYSVSFGLNRKMQKVLFNTNKWNSKQKMHFGNLLHCNNSMFMCCHLWGLQSIQFGQFFLEHKCLNISPRKRMCFRMYWQFSFIRSQYNTWAQIITIIFWT